MLTSNKIYFRVLQILAVSLSLLLIYQVFFTKSKESKLTPDNNVGYGEQIEKDNSIESAINIITTFSKTEMEKLDALPVGRNLFQNGQSFEKSTYYEKTPDIEKITPLTTLQISELVPNRIYLQNKPIKFLVKGINLSENMKVYANGNLLETSFIDSSQIQATLSVEFLSLLGNLRVEVKTQKLGKEVVSNPLLLTLTKPPMPNFTFVGMFSDAGGQNTNLLVRVGREDFTVTTGDLIKNRWKIISLSGDFLAFEDIETKISYRVKKGEELVSAPMKEIAQDKPVASEAAKKSDTLETNLFERSNKPMTSKQLWEKRAAMAREN